MGFMEQQQKTMLMGLFWVESPCGWVGKSPSTFFSHEDGDSTLLRNIGFYHNPYGESSRKYVVKIFTAVKIVNLTKKNKVRDTKVTSNEKSQPGTGSDMKPLN
jgi:hypothetical protein